jgi:hypothetical protein
MKFEIDDDMVHKIVVAELKKDFISKQEDIARLVYRGKPLEDYEVQDLWDFRETAAGLATVLKYYMYLPDAEGFIRDNTVPCGIYNG